MAIKQNDVLFALALLCAVWFAWTGMVWTYGVALFIAYPFGALSLLLWTSIKKENRPRTKWIPIILSIGLILSLSVLIYLLIWD
jgi:O-antigen/teichoic acid export membrane protein